MRKLLFVSMICLVGAAAFWSQPTSVFAQAEVAQAEVEKKAKKKKDKRVCRYIRETGSRIRERVCRKQSDWDRLESNARESVNRTAEESRRSTAGGDT